MIASVTGVLGTDKSLNIAYMRVYRKERGGVAIMIIETDQRVDNTLCEKVRNLRWVHDVTVIEPIE